MKRVLIALTFGFLLLSSISAFDISTNENEEINLFVKGINKPITFPVSIENKGATDSFRVYNLLGFQMEPTEYFEIKKGEIKTIDVTVYPRENLPSKGFYSLAYTIKGTDGESQEEKLLKIVHIEDAFKIGATNFNSESNSLTLFIENKENFNFENLNVKFSSVFFSKEDVLDITSLERKEIEIELNKEDFNKLTAGFYTLKAEVSLENAKGEIENTIKFEESNLLKTEKDSSGIFVRTETITKTNNGNTIENSEIIAKKNVISRLFTSFNVEPERTERKGLSIFYYWTGSLKPSESQTIIVKTNWFFPFFLIFLIIAIVTLTKKYLETDVVLKKRVTFVKARGGEFALKVKVFINAKSYVERVSIIDRLPPLVKIYEKFGNEEPLRVDEQNKRIEWGFEKLEAGETRILTYIIYSKVGVLGRFALPRTTAIYERDGKVKESNSNRTFFVAEIRKEDQIE